MRSGKPPTFSGSRARDGVFTTGFDGAGATLASVAAGVPQRAYHRAMTAITEWLVQARNGQGAALERVFEALYPELRQLARMRAASGERTLTPTVLVHEVYLRMLGSAQLELNDRRHFMACAARAMRAVSVDHARRRSALKRGGPGDDIDLDAIEAFVPAVGGEIGLIELDAALDALERFNPRLRELVELHYFAGLPFDEIAVLHACSLRTTMREWARARAFLHARLDMQA